MIIMSGYSLSQISKEAKVPMSILCKLLEEKQRTKQVKNRSEAYINVMNYIKDHCLNEENLKLKWLFLYRAIIEIRNDGDKFSS